MAKRLPEVVRRVRRGGVLVLGSALASVVAVLLATGVVVTSACTDDLLQPTDAGPFVVYEGGHPPPSMYGSPCEIQPVERCCAEVAKEIPGEQCYGCTGKVA